MAWIESHQTLARHPKTMRASLALGISRVQLIGHLHLLWWWCLDYALDGVLHGLSDREIAAAAEWDGDAEAFTLALTRAGFLEADDTGTLHIHDWYDYAEKWIERRAANAARMRETRASKENPTRKTRATHVQRTSSARAGATKPNQTIPNLTEPEIHPPTPRKREEATATPPRALDRPRNEIFDALKEACGYDPAATLTGQESTRIGKAAADIKRAGGEAAEVAVRAERFERKYPHVAITPLAIAAHWGELAVDAPARASPNGHAPVTFQEQIRKNNRAHSAAFLAAVEEFSGQQAVRHPDGPARRSLPDGSQSRDEGGVVDGTFREEW